MTNDNQTTSDHALDPSPCAASSAVPKTERQIIAEAHRDRLNQGLRTLAAWCASRAANDHDTETTLTMLEKKATALRGKILKAGWAALQNQFMPNVECACAEDAETGQDPDNIVITAIIQDRMTPWWPLIYTVNARRTDVDEWRLLPEEESTARIKRLVAEERHKDCGVPVKTLEKDIELLFAFKGDLHPVCDWRL